MRTWPTEQDKKRQLRTAELATIAAAFSGLTLLGFFRAFTVLCAIVMAFCAAIQWSVYLNIQTKLDIKAILSSQGQDETVVRDELDAGDV